jgi:hypothetical protein
LFLLFGKVGNLPLKVTNPYQMVRIVFMYLRFPEQEEIELMIDAGNGDLLAAETEENEGEEND